MRLTDNEAAARRAGLENALTEYARRKRNNMRLNAAVLLLAAALLGSQLTAFLIEKGVL